MMYKCGPYYADGGERVYKHIEPNGGSVIQYFTGDRSVYEFWVSKEEESIPHKNLMEIARAQLVLSS